MSYQIFEAMERKRLPPELDVKLNRKQNKAWNMMRDGENILLTGSAGSGKSLLIKMFKTYYQEEKIISITSTTGTSALLIKGVTLHSYLGIGLGTGSVEALTTKILKKSYLKRRWTQLETLIIDEVSMLSPELFDKLEEIGRRVRKNNRPFGDIQLILSGDWLQLPVVKSDNFCFEAKSWERCISKRNIIYLTENMRQKDIEFQECLDNIRIGNINDSVKTLLRSRIGIKLDESKGIKPTRLFPTNARVDEINNRELDKLARAGKEFNEYKLEIDFYRTITTKNKEYLLNKHMRNFTAPETLHLCEGVQVMLLVNLDLESGLANGSRGVVVRFIDDYPLVRFVNGIERVISEYIWEIEENDQVVMSMSQIPLKIAYAATIHKCQGATIDFVEVELKNIFEYSQGYVALSRVRSLEGLSIRNINFKKFKVHPKALRFYLNLTPMYTFMSSAKDVNSSPYQFFNNSIYDFNMMKEINIFLN
jgi:ATP-dependent DNA helicase PIF1